MTEKTTNAVDLKSVEASIEVLIYVKAQRARLSELEDEHRPRVQEALGDAEFGALDDKVVVSWRRNKQRRLNQKKLAEDHPDLVEEYKEIIEARRFEIIT